MLPSTETFATIVDQWLAAFETSLASPLPASLAALFHRDSHWRDLLALSWDIRTVSGLPAIAGELRACAGHSRPSAFRLDTNRTPPRHVTRAGTEAIEAIFSFETAHGRGSGVVRLKPETDGGHRLKAWTLLTALDDIDRARSETARPGGNPSQRSFRGPNWLDRRKAAVAYADREPTVLVIGAGQAGLSIAARLTRAGIDTLIVEREPRIGDTWRKRYHALTLHTRTYINQLPDLPFPPGWPTFIPKDKLAGWFEAYAESMELNAWTATELEGATWDAGDQRWTAVVRRADGTRRELRPRHLVMATGVSGIPNVPEIPTLRNFAGTVVHSSRYDGSSAWQGRRALVIGTGTSGHDIAQDLHAHGAQVTLVQRATTMVVNIEPSAQLPYKLYEEGPPLADCDLITTSMPLTLLKTSYQLLTEQGRKLDLDLLERLERRGFRLDFGTDGTGWQYKYLTRGGGYYFNVGCSDLIADGEIGLVQFSDITGFVAEGARLGGGETLAADLVVLATGYKGLDALVARLLGRVVADRVGPIWGFGEDQELRNMFKRTAQPGLWFIAGSFAQCRIYSTYLALQIEASELGLLPP